MKVYKGKNVPIKSWCENPEEGALDQARNLASLPFIFKQVDLMPDTHQGYGMPIGGVIATKGVVIPNAVGVDIGCFDKNTKVSLLDGSCQTLYELSKRNENFYVYSLDKIGKIAPGKAKALMTRKNAKVMQVCISGGEIITCTPDHKFMLLNGSYKEAKNLKPYDSLMPLYRSYESKDGYEHIKTKKGTSIATHKMVASYFLKEKKEDDVIHHKDGCWYNNEPNNIEYQNKKVHSFIHRKIKPIFGTDIFKIKRLKKLKQTGFFNKKYIIKKKEIAKKNLKIYNQSDTKIEQDKLAGRRGKKYLIRDNAKYFKCNICEKECKGLGAFSMHMKTHQINHKVLWVKEINKKINVYCLQVEKYHNFALASGIFVHNCGMCAVKTSININKYDAVPLQEFLKKIMGEIRKVVPVGFNHQAEKQDRMLMPDFNKFLNYNEPIWEDYEDKLPICAREYDSALKQIGTLGGGNHFIEIQKELIDCPSCNGGKDIHFMSCHSCNGKSKIGGNIWIMIHSGSRNLGKQVADFYNNIAKELNKKWFSEVPKKWDLAFLPLDSDEGRSYLREMQYCVDFALANRKLMMERIKKIIWEEVTDIKDVDFYESTHFTKELFPEEMINIAHNYASIENHFGQNVVVHRKGATLARENTIGIIPGDQKRSSYIVKGKGSKDSFMSCSHGAGRNMSRTKARAELDLEKEQKELEDLRILHSIRRQKDLDEAPGAYKDIDIVMEEQKDLVDILVKLKPLGVIKG